MKIWIWSYSQCRMCEWRRGDVCCGSMRDGIRCGGVVECCCCADGCCGGAANQGQNQPSADCTGLRVQLGTLIHCSVLQQQLQQLSIMMTAVNNNIISSCVPTITACDWSACCHRNFKALQNSTHWQMTQDPDRDKEYLPIYLQIPWLCYKQWAPITKGCSGIFQASILNPCVCLRPSDQRSARWWRVTRDWAQIRTLGNLNVLIHPYKSHSLVHRQNMSQGKRCKHVLYIFVLFIKRQEPDDGESECSLILS